jgi:E3 ubiquitin-protein ligase BIG BROTHER-like protein
MENHKTSSSNNMLETNNNLSNSNIDNDIVVVEDEHPPQNPNDDPFQLVENSTRTTRTAFSNLSQIDADLALARTLQEQERAYMMLRMNNDRSDYGSWEDGSHLHDDDDFGDPHNHTEDDKDDNDDGDGDGDTDADGDEDAFDVHACADAGDDTNPIMEFDPHVHSSDEAYARALQEAEEREMAARLLALAGISDSLIENFEDHSGNAQDAWEEVDPDELSYEELLALGEVVGTESRGLSADTIASLPSINYKAESSQNGSNDSCVICRLDFEDGEALTLLSCKHSYHPECIHNWLKINKVCPVCSTEVSTVGHS